MECQGGEAAVLQAPSIDEIEILSLAPVLRQGVDHDVADEVDPRVGHALGAEVVTCQAVRGEEVIADDVGAQTVDLFGHGHVSRPQAGLDVSHPYTELLGGDGAGQGGVDVAHDDHQVRPLVEADPLEGQHDARRLLAMTAGAHAEIDVGPRQTESVEEGLAHARVVVLARVHQDMPEAFGEAVERFDDRRHLHEVGTRADDVDDLQNRTALPLVARKT